MATSLIQEKPLWRRVRFALGICLVLLALMVVPAVMDVIQSIDGHGAYLFNSVAGRSPVFDRFVLLLADEDGRERVNTLAVVAFLVAVWLAPTRLEKSRLLGTFLFIALVVLLYVLVDSLLDDVIERKSPSMEFLRPFNDIGKILDNRVDVKDRRSFPNLAGMILFTIGFMLIRLGRRPGGFIAVALGMTVPLLLCVAGVTWLSDIYLGSLPIAFLVSALAVETPFRVVHGTMMDWSAAGIDEGLRMLRGMVPMWKHRRLYWRSQNVFYLEVAVKRFAAMELPKVLDPDNLHDAAGLKIEMPLGGLRSVVRIASLGGKKVVMRAYPLNRRHEADQHFNASNYLSRHGVRVPKLLHYVNNPRRFGALFIVEEFVEGVSKRAPELTAGDVDAAAIELARLHSVTAEVWGPLDVARVEDYGTVLLRRIEKQLTKVARGPVLAGRQDQVADVRAWFLSWREEMDQVRLFCLVHGKLHRENCLFEADGRFCLLDTTTLEWGVGASDLVVVQHSLCGGRADLVEDLHKAYFPHLKPEEVQMCQRLLPLYEAIFFLGQVQKSTKRLRRTHRQLAGNTLSKGAQWWNEIVRIVGENPR